MDIRINDKGKYFTPRVTKDTLPAFIRTADQIIVGDVYVRPEHRLKDDLSDDPSRFLAVTDANVYSATDEALLYSSSLLLIAYQHIILLTPLEAMKNVHDAPWAHFNSEEEQV